MNDVREEMFEAALEEQINMYDRIIKEVRSDNTFAHEIVVACNEACKDTVRDILQLHRELRDVEKRNQ